MPIYKVAVRYTRVVEYMIEAEDDDGARDEANEMDPYLDGDETYYTDEITDVELITEES